jgi:hypothetical protein
MAKVTLGRRLLSLVVTPVAYSLWGDLTNFLKHLSGRRAKPANAASANGLNGDGHHISANGPVLSSSLSGSGLAFG